MNKYLRFGLIGTAALVVLVLILPFLVPVDAYRARIETATEHATGRTLSINGPLRLMLFPQFGLRAEKVTFANMPGGHAAAMVSVGDIKLAIRFLPLLTGKVELAQIVLDRPTIELEVNAAGEANWMLGKRGQAGGGGSSVTLPQDTEFSGIKISDGAITYDNAKTKTHRAVDHVNALIDITRLDRPIKIDGNLMLAARRVDFNAKIATLKSFLGDGLTSLNLSLTSDMMQASIKGLVEPGGEVKGDVKFDTTHLRAVAQWLGENLPAGGGLNAMSLESHILSKDKITRFSPLRLALDRQNLTGDLTVDTRGKTTALTGTLSADRFDLNPYLQAPGKPGPKPALSNNTGWSRTPINFALPKDIDAGLTLRVGALRVRSLELGKTVAYIVVSNGTLNARLDPITLYGGTGRAELDIAPDGHGGTSIGNRLLFDRIALRPFLENTLGIDRIEGTGSLTLAVQARGDNAYAVMHSLSGSGAISATHGRIRGVDLGAVARTVQMVLGGEATGQVATTDFHDMGGHFDIASGVLNNKDFRLAGPLASMTGAGDIDIGNQSIDFRLVPKAAVKGIAVGIPFRVKGSWDHVHYAPDLAGVVKGVLQNLESGRAPFKGLFGGDNKTHDNAAPKKKHKSTTDVLKNMFGIH